MAYRQSTKIIYSHFSNYMHSNYFEQSYFSEKTIGFLDICSNLLFCGSKTKHRLWILILLLYY